MADAGVGVCIVVSSVVGVGVAVVCTVVGVSIVVSVVGVAVVCTGVGVDIVVNVVGVVCAGVGVCIVTSDAVGVSASVVYVGGGRYAFN